MSCNLVAQGNVALATRSVKLQTLSENLKKRDATDRRRVQEFARHAGIPLRRELANGRVLELQRVTPGLRPTFYITNNLDAADTVSTLKVWPGQSAGLDLDGGGMTVGEWDGGAIYADHPDFIGRLTQMDGATIVSGHSTHVAGTLIGSGLGLEPRSRGMAFSAQLNAWDWNSDTSEMALAAAGGLLISNHSYGIAAGWIYIGDVPPNTWWWIGGSAPSDIEDPYFGYYDAESRLWDQIAFDAPYYLIVKASGNDRSDTGPTPGEEYTVIDQDGNPLFTSTLPRNADCAPAGYDCLPTHSVAKNVLTVGAVDDVPGGYSALAGPSQVQMAPFSSWGPTDDGRIKPDVVGNGVFLISAWPDSPFYAAAAGTSMAAPNVTGSLLLLQEHYEDIHGAGNYMRSATLKALAIHTADEAGNADGPDYAFGWGLLNTRKAANVITGDGGGQHRIIEGSLSNGSDDTLQFDVTQANGVLTATLVWMDPPGTPVALKLDAPDLMLKNDLDLRVTSSPDTYLPWILDPANPAAAATRGDNFRDNVEQVVVDGGGSGTYTITVSHKGNLLNGSNQDYSLIVSETTALPTGSSLLIDEDFSGGLPAGWSVVTLKGIPWTINAPVPGNSRLDNGTGGSGNFAIVDSNYGNETVTSLLTSTLDLSSAAAVVLRFKSYYNYDFLESLNVDISTDGGIGWSNAWTFQGFNPLPTLYTLDLTGAIAGHANAVLRFRFDSEGWIDGDFWQIDDVELDVFGSGPPPGGNPPGQATNPGPTDGNIGLGINTYLTWSAGTGTTSHDVYFGTDSTPDASESQGNQTGTTFDPGTLAYSTTYYWRVDGVNDDGLTTGDVWSFTTEVEQVQPGIASSPTPSNNALDVSISGSLSWTAGTGAISHDVYFGSNPTPAFQGNQTGTSYSPGALLESTTYFWRIDEVNGALKTTGPTWNFTTGTAPAFHLASLNVVAERISGPRYHGVATITVRDTGGSPVEGVAVSGTFSGDWSGLRGGTTDNGGQLVVTTPAVKNGSSWAFCVDTASKTSMDFDVPGSAAFLCDAPPPPATYGSISGTVMDTGNGAPIQGAVVSADTGQGDTTDTAGSYTLTAVPTGTRTVNFNAAGYGSTASSTTVAEDATSTLNVSMTPIPVGGGTGSLKGTVKDDTGARIKGAVVQVVGGASATTNKGGKYSIQTVSEGQQFVIASYAGYNDTNPIAVTITAGATATLDITLNP
jgi:hypothetical protein